MSATPIIHPAAEPVNLEDLSAEGRAEHAVWLLRAALQTAIEAVARPLADHEYNFDMMVELAAIKTHINELDRLMGGGLPADVARRAAR